MIKRIKKLFVSAKEEWYKFNALATKEKVGTLIACTILAVILYGISYFLYKVIVLIFPLLLIGGLYFWEKSDSSQAVSQIKPEQYNIDADAGIITQCFDIALSDIGDLLALKKPSQIEDLYVGVFDENKLLFRLFKNSINNHNEILCNVNDMECSLNDELNNQFRKKYDFFHTTKEGLQIMGIEDKGLYYHILISPINDNTRAMIIEKQNRRLTQHEFKEEKDLFDEF